MSERSVTHATFVLERRYEASPVRVFAAWADPALKARWFGGAEMETAQHEMDFRVGGQERVTAGQTGGPTFTFDARYQDIVPNERIVHAYDMYTDETLISVSLATVEFRPDGAGTRLVYTEQGAFLDGLDSPHARERGTAELLDSLGQTLGHQPASA